MEIPQPIKNLPREKLEKFCVNLMNSEHRAVHRANNMEKCIEEIEKYMKSCTDWDWECQAYDKIQKIIDNYRKWLDEC